MKFLFAPIVTLLSCLFIVSHAQAPIRKLPQTINRPNVNITAPFISLDGNTLVFISDYAEDNEPTVYYAKRDGANWKEPKMLPKHINNTLNYTRGYALSADGNTIYITTIKSGGLGGYDIWGGPILGTSWNDLENMYLPINSNLHEGSPAFSIDGRTMYFMRCEKMDKNSADRCKILVSQKSASGKWGNPVELSANINTGNSQTPRISADGEILIFASNAIQPNKGGMDLYVSKIKNGSWTDPIPLDFINTDGDDQFVSSIANGRYLLKDAPGKFKREIIEYLMPEEWRPRAVMKIEGLITDANGKATPAYISVVDSTRSRIITDRPDERGNFVFYLVAGNRYEVSIDPELGTYTYFSKTIDMTGDTNPLVQKINAVLKPIQLGDELDLEGIKFKPHSAELNGAESDLRRLFRLIRSSPQFAFEIQVLLVGYEEDSVQLKADLTEISVDSLIVQLEEIDSTGLAISRDSLIVKTTYHNNRTEKQSKTIIDALVSLGADEMALTSFVNVRPDPLPENHKTIVRVAVRKKNENPIKN